jgi:hypothetical protein
MSYNGTVNFGLTADYDGMADLDDLAADLAAALGELSDAAGERGPRAAPVAGEPAGAKATG